jgi:outer membrane lipoprotein-sorting protein
MLKHHLLAICFACSFLLPAQSAFKPMKDTADFKQKIDKMSRETRSIESEFVQVKNLSMLSEKISSKGIFCFEKQNNLRWEYTSPYRYVIVINQDKILIKDESHKVKKYDMNANKVFREINDIMISCVNGEILKSKKFSIRYFESDKAYKLELVPTVKSMKESLQKIHMYFDKQVTSVVKLEMIENGEDMTSIEFMNKKINAPVSPDTFTLK